MRIGFIVSLYGIGWGGSEELWAATAERAIEAGHSVGLSVYPGAESAPRVQKLIERGAQVWVRPFKPAGRLKTAFWRLRQPYPGLSAWRPDVILVNEATAFGEVVRPLNKSFLKVVADIPYVIVCHGNGGWPFPSVEMRLEARDAYQKAKKIGTVSQNAIDLLSQQLANPLSNAVVVCNPVKEEVKDGIPWPEDDVMHIATAGRIDMVKAPDLLFQALSGDAWRNRKWHVDLYGDGDRDYYEEVARFYRVHERVTFHGHVANVRAVWERAHLLAMPSRTEGVPISLIEAMLAGRPAVVTDVGGISEWVTEGRTGFIAEAPRAKYISAALERAWLARDRWKAIGAAAREFARKKQSADPAFDLLQMLEHAANEKATGVNRADGTADNALRRKTMATQHAIELPQ